MNNEINEHILEIMHNNNLSAEEKGKQIKSAYASYDEQVEKDMRNRLLKNWLGGAIEIGSSAIPAGGAAKAGASVGSKLFTKYLGKKLSQEIGSGALSGLSSGAVFGLGRGLIENENPLKTILQDGGTGLAAGSFLGGIFGKLSQDARIKYLKDLSEKRHDWGIAYRQASGNPEQAIETLLEHKQGFVPEAFDKKGIGKTDLVWGDSTAGIQHIIERRNAQGYDGIDYVKHLPEFINDGNVISKKGHVGRKYISDESTETAIRQDWNGKDRNWVVSSYYKYGKAPNQELSELRPLNKTYADGQVISPSDLNKVPYNNSQVVPGQQTYRNSLPDKQHIPLSDLGNTIISENSSNINPSYMAIPGAMLPSTNSGLISGGIEYNVDDLGNRIYTREDIGEMTSDEFSANEKSIMEQLNTYGIPTRGDMERAYLTGSDRVYVRPYTRSDGTEVRGYYRSK